MEATGVYHEQLAWQLHLSGYRVCVLLPNKVKSYLRYLGHKSKNDKMDAEGMAKLGANNAWNNGSPPVTDCMNYGC
ncbi:Transposase [compost metagenome]